MRDAFGFREVLCDVLILEDSTLSRFSSGEHHRNESSPLSSTSWMTSLHQPRVAGGTCAIIVAYSNSNHVYGDIAREDGIVIFRRIHSCEWTIVSATHICTPRW